MIITVASYKGGVAKTTTAIHLAAYFQKKAPTLLIDGDIIRAATKWSERGEGFAFKVVDETQGIKAARDFINGYTIIDTEANPSRVDFKEVAEGCDLLVIPAVPERTATDGLIYTLSKLHETRSKRYKVLITKAPPKPQTDADKLRAELRENNIPCFSTTIPRLKVFDTASAQGMPVYDVKNEYAKTAWAAYQSAGKEIIDGQR